MGNKYTIRINNNTASDQNYNLLSEKPDITGVSKSNVWTNLLSRWRDYRVRGVEDILWHRRHLEGWRHGWWSS
ncbi:hypothetical protein NW756_000130 [Fusarium oxysporum]|nr:hypothetical protein NW763_006719 [Fusarium oxysporum]KAJ4062613.1 hypothetical protein NW753_004083 [Fusarium oxysporum]KAJ4104373.1 hypothetical protein NW756_000130 [Fusarium oxysporum]